MHIVDMHTKMLIQITTCNWLTIDKANKIDKNHTIF